MELASINLQKKNEITILRYRANKLVQQDIYCKYADKLMLACDMYAFTRVAFVNIQQKMSSKYEGKKICAKQKLFILCNEMKKKAFHRN